MAAEVVRRNNTAARSAESRGTILRTASAALSTEEGSREGFRGPQLLGAAATKGIMRHGTVLETLRGFKRVVLVCRT